MNRQVTLAARPVGEPKESDFSVVEGPVPEDGSGEVVVHALYVSIDPYQRGRMSEARSYARSLELGDVITSQTVGEVLSSEDGRFTAGDLVSDYAPRFDEAIPRLARWLAEGKLRYREDVTEGLENAPRAFMGILRGENRGKTLVKVR